MASAEVEIRPFAEADRAAVIALWREAFPDDPPWNEPEVMIRLKCRVQPELFLVGCVDGRVVGAVMAGFDGVRGWIHHLAVAPGARRKGVAARLMHAAERGLARLGCPKVNLQIRSANNAVVAFYRAIGYAVEDHVSMGKRLGGKDPRGR